MYESGANSEGVVDYNLLFCQGCLSSNRTLTMVGDYIDIYLKICEISPQDVTSQINLCWECMALLKKVQAFKKKVENAQKILDYCVNKQAPLQDNSLSDLNVASTEVTTFYELLDEDEYENEDDLDKSDIRDLEGTYYTKDLEKDAKDLEDSYYSKELDKSDAKLDLNDDDDELMIRIENVRGQCDIVDVNHVLDVSGSTGCEATTKVAPLSSADEEHRHRRWKRSVLLVHNRICGHKYARYFLRPVSDELAPSYSRAVRRPTDLSAIKRRVRDGLIRTTEHFRHALLLMFSNALMYNGSDYNIYHMTLEMREETLRELEILSAAEAHALSPSHPLAPARRRAPSPAAPLLSPPPPTRAPTPPARPVSPPTLPPPAPRRRRHEWTHWPEHDHLLAIKKYKTAVVLQN